MFFCFYQLLQRFDRFKSRIKNKEETSERENFIIHWNHRRNEYVQSPNKCRFLLTGVLKN